MHSLPITIVSGIPRSGTSLMMQMLSAGGLPPLSDDLRRADSSNPNGYFEYEPVKHLRKDASWLQDACGHCIKIIYLLLRELPLDGSLHYKVIFMERPLSQVLASQAAMLELEKKLSGDKERLEKIFEKQLADLKSWLGEQSMMEVIWMPYSRVLNETQSVIDELAQFLNRPLNVEAMLSTVDSSLYRQRQTGVRIDALEKTDGCN
jgi:hypothetical protein